MAPSGPAAICSTGPSGISVGCLPSPWKIQSVPATVVMSWAEAIAEKRRPAATRDMRTSLLQTLLQNSVEEGLFVSKCPVSANPARESNRRVHVELFHYRQARRFGCECKAERRGESSRAIPGTEPCDLRHHNR